MTESRVCGQLWVWMFACVLCVWIYICSCSKRHIRTCNQPESINIRARAKFCINRLFGALKRELHVSVFISCVHVNPIYWSNDCGSKIVDCFVICNLYQQITWPLVIWCLTHIIICGHWIAMFDLFDGQYRIMLWYSIICHSFVLFRSRKI